MKKLLFLFFALMLCISLCFTCLATSEEGETEQKSEVDIKAYIQEKIVPIVVGVVTSIVALITTLYKIGASLKALSGTRETLDADAKKREAAVASLGEQVEQIKASIKDVPSLEKSIEELKQMCGTMAEILSLGFSANEEIIKSGKGRQMSVLLENAKLTPSPQGKGKGE